MNTNFFVLNINNEYGYEGETEHSENTLVFCGTYEECQEYVNNHPNYYDKEGWFSKEYFVMEFGKTVVTVD